MGMADAVLSPPAVPVEHRVILDGISWETYERLLADQNPGRGKRFTYDSGVLQIVVLSSRHEWPNRVLANIAELVAVEMRLPIEPSGSTTFKRADLQKGFEPDSSFYIENSAAVDMEDLDLRRDPPPDLVIEIDITEPSLWKLPMFAEVGVREVWRYDGAKMYLYVLNAGRYESVERSFVLPVLTNNQILHFLNARKGTSYRNWTAGIRDWVKANR
jgi:Uma2 family endonuclease